MAANKIRFLEKKLFNSLNKGDIIQINLENDPDEFFKKHCYSGVSLRPVKINDLGFFEYSQKTQPYHKRVRISNYYILFEINKIGLYLGKLKNHGLAVVLLDESMYAIPVYWIKKVEKKNE